MVRDILDILEESWAYQEMVEKGFRQGFQQGFQQGLQKGELRTLRQAIVDVVQERFPEILASVEKRVQTIGDPSLLRLVIVKMSILPTAKEAQQYVRSIAKDRKDSYKSR